MRQTSKELPERATHEAEQHAQPQAEEGKGQSEAEKEACCPDPYGHLLDVMVM